MSLLMDALKRAETAKQEGPSHLEKTETETFCFDM